MSTKFFVALIVCALTACAVLFIRTRWVKAEDTLILGTMSGWPPFVSINNRAVYEGFDIDIAQEIARRLNKKLVIEDMDTAALITALNQDKVDFIMTGLDITPARREKIAMIPYQGDPITEFPLIFWKEIRQGVKSLDDLKEVPGAIICVEAGSSQEEFLEKFKGFSIKNVDPLASVLELKSGRATAVLLETKLFNELKSKFPELIALMVPLKDQALLGCGIGVKKTNTILAQKFEAIIADLKKSGFLKERETRWFKKEKQ